MGEEVPEEMETGEVGAEDEKILVSVRVRPLNEKEAARNDLSDWQCVDNNTIVFKRSLPERSMFPTSYTFDRVFGIDSLTEEVYEDSAKKIALSVVKGINSTIFAYGQTSSGKTYTMGGITRLAVADVYEYIATIYNEAVRDLLSLDITPLRLLDDPERGTVVEKLTEETLRDQDHLHELLSVCEAERQVGETNLNETSSRSHQILRLTVDSSAHQYAGARNSSKLAAQVNFVDLAGSERASQTQSAGTRLKEGCHINRSLLTLGTVVRKLSKGRNAHVPYRDSKLTRILQNSLGGNARTAIICTMSPARSHVEQSRNTLLFASCAKEVSTNARVNLVMSDKVLVKQLQRELARLASEMQNLGSADASKLLREKEKLITQMSGEIQELTEQRDLAQSRVENLLRSTEDSQKQERYVRNSSLSTFCNELLENPEDNFLLDDSTPKFGVPDLYQGWEEIAQRTRQESSDLCRQFGRVELEQSSFKPSLKPNGDEGISVMEDATRKIPEHENYSQASEENKRNSTNEFPSNDEILYATKEDRKLDENAVTNKDSTLTEEKPTTEPPAKDMSQPEEKEQNLRPETPPNEDTQQPTGAGRLSENSDETYDALNEKIHELQRTIEMLINSHLHEESPCVSDRCSSGSLNLIRSRSCRPALMAIPSTVRFDKTEYFPTTPPPAYERNFTGGHRGLHCIHMSPGLNYGSAKGKRSRKIVSLSDSSVEMQSQRNSDSENDTRANEFFIPNENCQKQSASETKAPMRKHFHKNSVEGMAYKKIDELQESLKTEETTSMKYNWPLEFERQQRSIIELWDACNVPLVHRSYFFLLFKGDPSDAVYLEVELRRLKFLKSSSIDPSSTKELIRERGVLARKIYRKFHGKEKEQLYVKWDIDLRTKQRSLQLARRLWTNTKDLEHIKGSADLVAKLVGFEDSGKAHKEVFGLSIIPGMVSQKSYSWRHIKSKTSLF